MRTLVVGCGSIGRRRAAILAEMGHDVVGYDPSPEAVGAWPFAEWDGESADAVLICSPPATHLEAAADAVVAHPGAAIYVEKPIALEAAGWPAVLDGSDGRVTMGACNMRFDARIQAAEPAIRAARHRIYRMGQHARYWAPGHAPVTLLLDSTHEFDLALWLGGGTVGAFGKSALDAASVTVWHANDCESLVILDRTTDPPERYVWLDDGTLVTLWPPDLDMYRREMEHFTECAERGEPTCNPLGVALTTLEHALHALEVPRE